MCGATSRAAGFLQHEGWAEDDLEDLSHLCDWLLEPGERRRAQLGPPLLLEAPARRAGRLPRLFVRCWGCWAR